jgi:RadC-like JAB domain
LVCHLCLLWLKRAEQYTQILHINIEDVLVTRQIVEAGALFDVEALDHLVIGQGRYISMREKGLGFPK